LSQGELRNQLDGLVKLQEIDSKIYSLRIEKQAKPQEIKELEVIFESKKAHLFELEKKSLDIQKQRKDAEGELAQKEESTKKLQGQLSSLKTNKEYQTMLQQIQDSKADASTIEDKILGLFAQTDGVKTEVDKEKQKIAEEEKVFSAQKKEVNDKIKEIEDKLVQAEAQRKQVLPRIEPKILEQYERILSSREGLAIVPVKGTSCGGCNMFVPPQAINLIKMYDHIITCEMCNRILYVDESS
jgi:predicted  nucleic acid-binding Zn-ribbon protein